MQITSIAPWFGAKRSIASEIVMQLGPHQSYWEPFCGSMAVLLAKQPSRSETVNDLHGPLTTLARVLASDDARILYDRLQRTLMCEGLFNEVRQSMANGEFTTDLDVAYAFFCGIMDGPKRNCWNTSQQHIVLRAIYERRR